MPKHGTTLAQGRVEVRPPEAPAKVPMAATADRGDERPIRAKAVEPPDMGSDGSEMAAVLVSQERIYLAVPFAEKDNVKALGGKWDPDVKRWFVPEGMPLGPFDSWPKIDSSRLDQLRARAVEIAIAPNGTAKPRPPQGAIVLSTRLYIDVPIQEKDQARALGAWWDGARSQWFVPPGTAIESFRRWLPDQQEKAPRAPQDPIRRLLPNQQEMAPKAAQQPFVRTHPKAREFALAVEAFPREFHAQTLKLRIAAGEISSQLDRIGAELAHTNPDLAAKLSSHYAPKYGDFATTKEPSNGQPKFEQLLVRMSELNAARLISGLEGTLFNARTAGVDEITSVLKRAHTSLNRLALRNPEAAVHLEPMLRASKDLLKSVEPRVLEAVEGTTLARTLAEELRPARAPQAPRSSSPTDAPAPVAVRPVEPRKPAAEPEEAPNAKQRFLGSMGEERANDLIQSSGRRVAVAQVTRLMNKLPGLERSLEDPGFIPSGPTVASLKHAINDIERFLGTDKRPGASVDPVMRGVLKPLLQKAKDIQEVSAARRAAKPKPEGE